MLYVSIKPGFYFGEGGVPYPVPYRNCEIVDTLDQAKDIIRAVFPAAVFSNRWQYRVSAGVLIGTRERMSIAAQIQQLEDWQVDCWMLAKLAVFPNSQAAELDDNGDRKCAEIVNGDLQRPDPAARLFSIGEELDVDPC